MEDYIIEWAVRGLEWAGNWLPSPKSVHVKWEDNEPIWESKLLRKPTKSCHAVLGNWGMRVLAASPRLYILNVRVGTRSGDLNLDPRIQSVLWRVSLWSSQPDKHIGAWGGALGHCWYHRGFSSGKLILLPNLISPCLYKRSRLTNKERGGVK